MHKLSHRFTRALRFSTNHIYLNLRMAYDELSEIEKFISAFKKALEINPASSDTHFGLAMAYYQKRVTDKLAEEEFLKAIDIDPTHLDARLFLSIVYADRGEIKNHAINFEKSLKSIQQMGQPVGYSKILRENRY